MHTLLQTQTHARTDGVYKPHILAFHIYLILLMGHKTTKTHIKWSTRLKKADRNENNKRTAVGMG